MEFEAPLVTGPELPAQRQSVVFEEDVIQFSTTMDYSLRPGDKVLAPWGPDQQCYGPGTVLLGLEARDPQRGKGAALGHSRSQAGDQAEERAKWVSLQFRGLRGLRSLPFHLQLHPEGGYR